MGHGKHSNASKILLVALALILICCTAVGSTLAWLATEPETVTNTFTTGDIVIELNSGSSGGSAPMIPGISLPNSPLITVKAGSERCWLFIKFETSGNFNDYLSYEIQDEWFVLPEASGVYYREVAAVDEDQLFGLFMNNCVTVKTALSNSDMHALAESDYPRLAFTAYAVQYMNGNESSFTAAEAWAQTSGTT